MTKFYIIIAYWNPKKIWLDRCFNSIIANNYKNVELILINDGSDYDVFDYNLQKKLMMNKVKYQNIKINHCGNSAAKAKGLEFCKDANSYIWFVDCDDTIDINALNNLNNFISRNKNVDIVNCRLKQYFLEQDDKFDNYLVASWPKFDYDEIIFNPQNIFFKKRHFYQDLLKKWDWSCAVNIFRKKFIDDFDIPIIYSGNLLFEDLYNCFVLTSFATKIASINVFIYEYWKNRSNSVSKSFINSGKEQYIHIIQVFEEVFKKINEINSKKNFNKIFFNELFLVIYQRSTSGINLKWGRERKVVYKKVKNLMSYNIFLKSSKNEVLKSFKFKYFLSFKKIISCIIAKTLKFFGY